MPNGFHALRIRVKADKQPSIVALIPARAGSKRVPDKNIRPLAGHPLIAYTISSALQSQVFSAVIVSTDSQLYGDIAGHYGAEVPYLRPSESLLVTSHLTLNGWNTPYVDFDREWPRI